MVRQFPIYIFKHILMEGCHIKWCHFGATDIAVFVFNGNVIARFQLSQMENLDLITVISIPYDEGWTVKVDGKKVDYYKVAGAFIGVDIGAGSHTVEFSYMPQGMLLGIAISVICMVLLLVSLQVEKKLEVRRIEKANAREENEKPGEKLAEEVETDIENLENV